MQEAFLVVDGTPPAQEHPGLSGAKCGITPRSICCASCTGGAKFAGGEGAEERPEGGQGGADDANVNFNVGPDATGYVCPCAITN